ncbi:MAG: hypothetical protein A2X18_13155 [Bacteroidetes bacterium GWF2_40_14]|nr:MAG: hypothetical protein A2X18_13155 [Bacteroidetes bacterium GWF2_40_14]HCS20776.1 RagB/SusD family nutrient uptake outer membrane protein [Bacteroidota bacterium]
MKNRKKYSPVKPLNWVSFIAILFTIGLGSCEKFIRIEPPIDQIVRANVFSDDAAAISAIRGIYSAMISEGFANGALSSATYLLALSADEMKTTETKFQPPFYSNSLLAGTENVYTIFWKQPYTYIYYANAILEGMAASTGMTAANKLQLEGEAKFVRAFCHFYLVNLFGDVPLVQTTDYQQNRTISRTPAQQVYQQIIADLLDAKEKLAGDYSISNTERIRPNKAVATALLARVYLYTDDWANAETQASAVIGNSNYRLLDDLNQVFLKNSEESIWQLMTVTSSSINTYEGNIFIPVSNNWSRYVTSELLTAFEANDKRREHWIGTYTSTDGTNTITYYPFKYKISSGTTITEYSMVMRLAEQYLIRAEARAQQNKVTGANSAETDVNTIRGRAGLNPTVANTKAAMLLAIEQERRVELFTEWGHRWLDLKRTNRANAVLGALSYKNWQSTDVLFPINTTEMDNNPNLTQNPGY